VINREDAIDTIIRYMDKKKVQIEVATLRPESPIMPTKYESIGLNHHKLLKTFKESYLDYIRGLNQLYRIVQERKIDIIHVHLFWPSLIAVSIKKILRIKRKKSIKVIIHRHYTHDIDYLDSFKRKVLKELEYWSYRNSDMIIVPTYMIKNVIYSDYQASNLPPLAVIPYVFNFDSEKYQTPPVGVVNQLRRSMKADEDTFVIINVGSHRWQKGQHKLLEAFREFHSTVPKSQLWLVGNGPDTDKLMSLARTLGLFSDQDSPCKFIGFKPAQEVRLLIASSDIFVHPTFSEAFPQVMIEALAQNKPLIITPVSGAVDYLIDKEHAFFVNINDSRSLAEALFILWKDPEFRNRLGLNGGGYIRKRFHYSFTLDRYEQIYNQLIGPKVSITANRV
jgi:glycosyltransferase involved in cell wall biosynthesis